ncbi:hypothetical protein M8C21_017882 [Ambrosia artemisiifolia]|uniref:Uncharacterized protein n=1 Tax=Ambrosia artemisiifolia TaxID=4212 RepID=A0AAD5C608_AMBAR|nr:hypothetical protein M8C21_017882 [Ambrosia artemisiifolia]
MKPTSITSTQISSCFTFSCYFCFSFHLFFLFGNSSTPSVHVFGASSGLGEMAYEYAKLGAYLVIIATKKPDSRLELVANNARELGSPDVLFIFADVSKVDECRTFVDETIKRFGRCE